MINKTNLAIFASGDGSNFHAIIKQWHATKSTSIINKIILITNQPTAQVIKIAHDLLIPCFIVPLKTTQLAMENDILVILKSQAITFIALAGYMKVLSAWFLNRWTTLVDSRHAIINLHPSLLPLFKGEYDAINQAWIQKHTETGITIHYVIPEVDAGEIIFQATCKILTNDTLERLRNKIHSLEHRYYWQVINQTLIKKNNHH